MGEHIESWDLAHQGLYHSCTVTKHAELGMGGGNLVRGNVLRENSQAYTLMEFVGEDFLIITI